jgi:hypothetical protein
MENGLCYCPPEQTQTAAPIAERFGDGPIMSLGEVILDTTETPKFYPPAVGVSDGRRRYQKRHNSMLSKLRKISAVIDSADQNEIDDLAAQMESIAKQIGAALRLRQEWGE